MEMLDQDAKEFIEWFERQSSITTGSFVQIFKQYTMVTVNVPYDMVFTIDAPFDLTMCETYRDIVGLLAEACGGIAYYDPATDTVSIKRKDSVYLIEGITYDYILSFDRYDTDTSVSKTKWGSLSSITWGDMSKEKWSAFTDSDKYTLGKLTAYWSKNRKSETYEVNPDGLEYRIEDNPFLQLHETPPTPEDEDYETALHIRLRSLAPYMLGQFKLARFTTVCGLVFEPLDGFPIDLGSYIFEWYTIMNMTIQWNGNCVIEFETATRLI